MTFGGRVLFVPRKGQWVRQLVGRNLKGKVHEMDLDLKLARVVMAEGHVSVWIDWRYLGRWERARER